MNLKQPLADLNISVSGCTYDIELNGVSILKDDEGIPVTVGIPVNEWMKADGNTLSMTLGPVKDAHQLAKDGDKCDASVSLALRDNGQAKDKGIILSKLSYESEANHLVERAVQTEQSTPAGRYIFEDGSLKKSESGQIIQEPIKLELSKAPLGPGVTVSREVKAPLNYPSWIWTQGEIIPDNAATKAELTQFFEQLFHDIKSKNMPALETLFKVRSKMLREAYYLPKDSKTTFDELKAAMNNPDMELVPLHPEYFALSVFGDSRLTKLYYHKGSADAAILMFNYKNSDASKTFDITLAKIKGKWVIVG